jgi:molecular chaperone GrpE
MSNANSTPENAPRPPEGGTGGGDPGDQDRTATAADDSSLTAELEEAKNRVLRAQAEIENVRKRARREIEEERRYANLPLLHDLLGVLDNLERAVQHAEQSEQSAGLLAGVKMVSDQLRMTLEKYHCRPIEAEGTPFDPNQHEAIGKEPRDDHPPGTVTRVTQTGYRLHDRVVRPAQVMISAPVESPDTNARG